MSLPQLTNRVTITPLSAGGYRYESMNQKVPILQVETSVQLSNNACEVALTGNYSRVYGQQIVSQLYICLLPMVANLGSGRKYLVC